MPAQTTGPVKPEPAPAAAPAGERPEWLPTKFATPEDFAKSYAELEAKQSQPNAEGANAEGTPPAPEGAPTPAPEDAQEAVQNAGLDYAALSAEYAEKGELSAENMAALAAAGISEDMVQQYVAGQEATATKFMNDVTADIGGAEALPPMLEWAKEGLSADEITAYDKVMESGDAAQVKIALAGLKARYDAVHGSAPKLLGGKPPPNAPAGFRSKAEMTAAMRDHRYKTDPAYRADVAAKMARTDWM